MQENIDYSSPNDGLGDKLRNAFIKVQNNFTELYNGKVDKVTGKGLSKNDFTDADKTKLDGIEAGAEVNVQADWGETDPLSDSFILNKPPALYSAFGYFHVADLATQTTPLAFLAATPLQLTNDGGGAFTNYEQAPYGVSDIWDKSRNQFAFAKLSVGDAVLVRIDLLISTTSINQNLRLYIKLGIGTPSEYDLLIDSWNEKSIATFEEFIKDVSFSIDNEDWRTAPAKIYILSDDDGSVKVNGWYIPIIRKSVNLINFNSDPLKLDKDTTAGVERAYIINSDGSQSTKATSEFKDVLEFANLASFPLTGETGKIYLALDTNKTYRWSVSAYIQIGNVPEVEQQLQRYWYSMTVNTLNTNLMLVNNTNSFTISGTASVVPRSGTLYYNSFAMNNYLSATANGSNCGIKNNNQGDGSYLEGFDSSFVFINNDINANCETTVGYYSLLSAIPNIAKSAYTAAFTGVGNDVGDTNLSFYCKRNTETPSYTKVDCGANFPAHTTTDAYILRMQMSRGFNGSGRTLKMTITNIITGAVFSHTFTDSQIPSPSANICMVVNRSNRNTGVGTNIRFSKWHQTKFIY